MEKIEKLATQQTVKAVGQNAKTLSILEMKKEFDRLNALFNRKQSFESSKKMLVEYLSGINDKGDELNSSEHRLVLGSGYNREECKITNLSVIKDCIAFMVTRIDANILAIDAEILKA